MESKNKLLLDTHVFIWWMKKDARMGKETYSILKSFENIIFLSIVTVLEIVLKKKTGKLKVPLDWKETLRESAFILLPITVDHVFRLESLPFHHRDPFDRILIAQAQVEGATLITADEKIWKYDIPILRA